MYVKNTIENSPQRAIELTAIAGMLSGSEGGSFLKCLQSYVLRHVTTRIRLGCTNVNSVGSGKPTFSKFKRPTERSIGKLYAPYRWQ